MYPTQEEVEQLQQFSVLERVMILNELQENEEGGSNEREKRS